MALVLDLALIPAAWQEMARNDQSPKRAQNIFWERLRFCFSVSEAVLEAARRSTAVSGWAAAGPHSGQGQGSSHSAQGQPCSVLCHLLLAAARCCLWGKDSEDRGSLHTYGLRGEGACRELGSGKCSWLLHNGPRARHWKSWNSHWSAVAGMLDMMRAQPAWAVCAGQVSPCPRSLTAAAGQCPCSDIRYGAILTEFRQTPTASLKVPALSLQRVS